MPNLFLKSYSIVWDNVIPVLHASVVLSAVTRAQVPALPGSVPVAALPVWRRRVQLVL